MHWLLGLLGLLIGAQISLAAFITLYVAAGLYRQYVLKDGTLERIK